MTIAVADLINARVLVDDGRELHIQPNGSVPLASLPALAEGAHRHGIAQLWLYGLTDLRLYTPSESDPAPTGGWDCQPDHLAPWIHCFKRGTSTVVDIATPQLDDASPWRDAPDARTLLDALTLYQREVGLPFHRSPSATAARLLRSLHSGRNTIRLEVIGSFPTPAHTGNTEAPMTWIRPLDEREQGMKFLHSYDKNGAFLAAAAGEFPIGFGEARFIEETPIPGELGLPGYFLVSCDDNTIIPSFVHRKHVYPAWHWVTTPTLRLLFQRAANVQVRQAFVWDRSHRSLEPWQKRLRDARAHLMLSREPGARIALAAVKATYSAFTGGYLASTKWDRTGDELYRPDVRHMIIATARCNLIRKVDQLAAMGELPVAVGGVDTIYTVSDDPDPVRACPSGLPLGDELRHFKVKDAGVPLDEVRGFFDESQGTAAKRLTGLQLRLSELRRSLEVTHA